MPVLQFLSVMMTMSAAFVCAGGIMLGLWSVQAGGTYAGVVGLALVSLGAGFQGILWTTLLSLATELAAAARAVQENA